ncbi:MAG: glycosyl hydrolase-related protein [Omnitrophica WOR_2 bacterium]
MTVTRSPIYAHHMPLEPDPGGEYTYIDQGLQRFQYALYPHQDGWEKAGTVRHAVELNQPPTTLMETYHPDGSLPQSDSFFSVDCDNILVSVIKKSEDSQDLIVRCIETSNEAVHAMICMPGWNRAFEVDFSPCEIKTIRIPRDRQEPVVETDLLEMKENGVITQPVAAGPGKIALYD